jgi:hypothetical protein
VGLLILANFLGPIYSYSNYLAIYLSIQKIYMLQLGFYVVMAALNTFHALKILKRVEQGERLQIANKRSIHHAIVLPIYLEDDFMIEQSLNYLAVHQRAKENYLVFLAFEERSEKPKERG